MKILICDPLHQAGLDLLDESGIEYHLLKDDERDGLPTMVGNYDAMIVRSMTKVTAEMLERELQRGLPGFGQGVHTEATRDQELQGRPAGDASRCGRMKQRLPSTVERRHIATVLHQQSEDLGVPEVRRVVVTQQAPAPTVTQAPTTQRSSGS